MKFRKPRSPRHSSLHALIEALEPRIAPALLIDAPANINVSETSSGGNDTLTVGENGASLLFTSPGGLVAGTNATQLDAFTVFVPLGGFNGVMAIDTGTGNDSVTLGSDLPNFTSLSIVSKTINPSTPIPNFAVGAGGLSLTATGLPFTIDSTISVSGGGSITINSPGLDLAGATILTTDTTGSISITTDSLTFEPGAVVQTDPASFVALGTKSHGMTFDLGGKESAHVVALTNAELHQISTGDIRIDNQNGPVTISALIQLTTPTDVDISAAGDITFNGPGSLGINGNASFTTPSGGLFGNGTPARDDLNAGSVTIQVGAGGVGTKSHPFILAASSLDDTSIGAATQFLDADETIILTNLSAAGTKVTLGSGLLVPSGPDIMNGVLLTVNGNGTLDLNGNHETISALNGTGFVGNSNATACELDFSSDAPFSLFSGVLFGNLAVTKDGPGKQVLLGQNTFTGTVTINSGSVAINSDAALGNPANPIVINDGTLETDGNFSIPATITAGGSTPTLDVASGNLTLTGSVAGALHKTGDGNLLFGAGFTGQAPVTANEKVVTVGGTTVGLGGSGDVILTIVPDPVNGGTRISAIELENTQANSVLNIKGPKDGTTTTIDQISDLDPNDTVGMIKLGPSVIFGSGTNDTVPDLDIAGKVKNLEFNDINANTLFNLGKGLPYNDPANKTTPDSYNNLPNVTLRNVLGSNVIIDVTGNGIAGDQPGSLGGGGLGKVIVNSWSDPGLIETSQSVGSFTLKSGDCNVVFQLDPNHLGALTTASIGKMAIINGAWGSEGSVVEGSVGSFSATQFLASADITAASMGKLTIKNGAYAGTTTLTDPNAKALGTFSVNGDYLGFINAAEGIANMNIKGDFKGSLSAQFIGSISAYSLDGTGTSPGDRDQIVATNGSLGTLKTSVRGIQNFEINVATVFNGFSVNWPKAPTGAVGIHNVSVEAGQINHVDVNLAPQTKGTVLTAIQDSAFESAASIGEVTAGGTVADSIFAATTNLGNVLIKGDLTGSKLLAGTSLGGDAMLGGTADAFTPGGTIGNVTVLGMFATTTIAAGVDPGAGLIYGDGDTVGTSNLVTGPSKVGALVFGATSGTVGTSSGASHSDAIEAAAIKSLKVGTAKVLKVFTTDQYLDLAGDGESMADVLVKLV